MKKIRYFALVAVFGVFSSIMALQQNAYAYYAGDINRHPTIIMDKRAIEVDRRMLQIAKQSGDSRRVKAVKERLKQDIAKLKADKAALKKKK